MISTIFQPEVSSLESQISQMQAQIAIAQTRITALGEAEMTASGALQALQGAVQKISGLAPDAIASLRTAVLSLFQGGDDSTDGDSNHKNDPTPPASPLLGQTCDIYPEAHWTIAEPDGSSWQLTSVLACLLEDAPESALTGQAVEIVCQSEDKSQRFVELIHISDALAYQRRHDGEIICVYAGFNNKATARRWGEWLAVHHSVARGFEVREARRLSGVKHELKLWQMSLKQLERLSQCNFSKDPRNSFSEAPQRQLETVPPAHPKVEVGDIVASTLVPTWHYEVLEILGDGKLSCRRLGVQPDLVVPQSEWSVTLVSKAQARMRIESKPLTVGEISAESALASIQPPKQQEFSYSLMDASNLEQCWSVSRSTPEGKQQFLGSVSCGTDTQRWSHSRQPKYGQNLPYYPAKEVAAAALLEAYERISMPRSSVATGIEPDF